MFTCDVVSVLKVNINDEMAHCSTSSLMSDVIHISGLESVPERIAVLT